MTERRIKAVVSVALMAITLSAMLFSSCNSSQKITKKEIIPVENYAFDFVAAKDLKSVLQQAGRENKLVFVDVYTTWCLPCKMMDQDVFTHQETADEINKNFISYKVDAEKENGLIVSFNYDVKQYPTLLFLDAEGKVLERKDGAAYQSELLSMAQSALDQVVIGD